MKAKFLILTIFTTTLLFVQAASANNDITESSVVLKTLGGNIYGTLAIPAGANGKMPVVLIVPDSGPIDHDGNSAKTNISAATYKRLAQDLGNSGIASLRYDKRLVGQSIGTTKENDMQLDDMTDDALGFINILKGDERFSQVVIFGHGEGALVGTLATTASDGGVSALVSAEGAGVPGDQIIAEQMKSQAGYIADGVKRVMDSLKYGKFTPKVDVMLMPFVRPSIQTYVMTWCRFQPDKEFKKLKIPTLIIHGSTDLQMKVDNANILKKAKSNSTLTIIPGMNHIFREAPADREQNTATFNKPELPLKPEFITAVTEFIKGLK